MQHLTIEIVNCACFNRHCIIRFSLRIEFSNNFAAVHLGILFVLKQTFIFVSAHAVPQLTIMLLLVASSESDTCDGHRGFPGRPGIPGVPGADGKDGPKGEKGDPGEVIALIFYVKILLFESHKSP